MIAFVRGNIFDIEGDVITVDMNGMGIAVQTPINTIRPLPAIGESIMLHTHLQVREDAWSLFGFSDKEQLEVFRYLISVSGIGAKTAVAIINDISISNIASAVKNKQSEVFCTVSGVGKKTAERLILELKDKFAKWGVEATDDNSTLPIKTGTVNNDVIAALTQLGFSGAESRALAAQATQGAGENATVQKLITEALRLASKH